MTPSPVDAARNADGGPGVTEPHSPPPDRFWRRGEAPTQTRHPYVVLATALFGLFTVGFTIEEQAHLGQDYDQNPYDSEHFDEMFDPRRYPLLGTVRSAIDMREPDQDFAFGLRIIVSGIRATAPAPEA